MAMRVLVMLAALALGVVRAAETPTICAITGLPAPEVRTLDGAYIVNPNCTYEEIPKAYATNFITIDAHAVERIERVPNNTKNVFTYGGLSRGADFSAAEQLAMVYITGASSITNLVFPPSTKTISLQTGNVENIEQIKLPADLFHFSVTTSGLRSLKNVKLPESLKELHLMSTQITEIDFKLPPKLTSFAISGNPITKIEGLEVPETLFTFECTQSVLTSIRGVNFPRSIHTISTGPNALTSFEIREYDLPVLKKAYTVYIKSSQTTCSDPTARIVSYTYGNACVISDDHFKELYGIELPPTPSPTTSPSSTPTPTNSDSSSSTSSPTTTSPADPPTPTPTPSTSTAGSTSESPSTIPSGFTEEQLAAIRASQATTTVSTTKAPKVSGTSTTGGISVASGASGTSGTSSSSESAPSPSLAADKTSANKTSNAGSSSTRTPATSTAGKSNAASRVNATVDASNPDPTTDSGAGNQASVITTVKSAPSSNSSLLVLLICIVGTAAALLLGALVCRAAVGARRKKDQDSTAYTELETPSQVPSTVMLSSEPRSQEFLENDIRNDPLLTNYRIEGSAITVGAPIAQGGFGVIYKGEVDGRSVAIKKMLPDTWRDEATVASFMDEIRMCVNLDHPKIVGCIGISWSSLRDLSVVIEYMDGGDLSSVLERQNGQPMTGREWSEPWTAAGIKSKSSIATDVAEAIVYLHAFSTPIIHRDLKAKNVLLDAEGNAKLSDFGISREVSMDETMTREVGTVAWIAPEVLRGERYSEKADMYSLGVLLVELDRCAHPYARNQVLSGSETTSNAAASQAVLKNTRIAILVSTGKLRPTVSESCPGDVQQLVERCLAFEPTERPSAQEVLDALAAMRAEDAQ